MTEELKVPDPIELDYTAKAGSPLSAEVLTHALLTP